MKKRIALNTFYTLGIVVSVVGLKWAYQNANYPVVGLLIATGIFFLYLKINIVKEVKTDLKSKEEQYKSFVKEGAETGDSVSVVKEASVAKDVSTVNAEKSALVEVPSPLKGETK